MSPAFPEGRQRDYRDWLAIEVKAGRGLERMVLSSAELSQLLV
jgi:hypothetical protein